MSRMMEVWMEGRDTRGQINHLLAECDGDALTVIARLIGRSRIVLRTGRTERQAYRGIYPDRLVRAEPGCRRNHRGELMLINGKFKLRQEE